MIFDSYKKYPLLSKLYRFLQTTAACMIGLHRKVEALSGKASEILALFIYTAAHLCMALVHEPFFDEAEAWQIARSATLKTLLLETTHYEGHPPLWHLILMPLAKAGAPYELSLTLVSLAFMGTAVFLILWYAPFPRLVRLLLPFTYFFFYQYGVISRVYCVMTLAFVLLAMAYRRRNERPGRYVAVLILMCVTLAYGLTIAGGLALVWLWEIGSESRRKRDGQDEGASGGSGLREMLCGWASDRRIRWLALLLAAAIGVIWMIMPRSDTYATSSAVSGTIQNSFAVRLFYTLFVLPADTVLTDIYCDSTILPQASLPLSALLSGAVIGLLIWGMLLYYGRKRGTVRLLVLPYGLFAVFSAAVYFSFHHIGIGLLYFCFWCWVSAEGAMEVCPPGESGEGDTEVYPLGEAADRRKRAVRSAAILFGTLAMAVSLFWTVAACVLDIRKNYAPGRNDAAFITEHHLDRYRMMSGWIEEHDAEGNIVGADISMCDQAVNLAPYFEHNLFFNFNGGRDDRNYITHIRLSEEETQRQYEGWREDGPPQVLWMSPNLSAVYGGTVRWQDYVPVYRASAEQVWKAGTDYKESIIYVQRALLEEAGLRPVRRGNGK